MQSPIQHLHAVIDDFRTWYDLYGLREALVLWLLARKSVWKMQARVLGYRPKSRANRPGTDRDDSDDPFDSSDPDDSDDSEGFVGQKRVYRGSAAQEYKDTVENESNRITVAVSYLHIEK
jgi:hypothetical protein